MKYEFLLPVERKFIEGLIYEAPLHMSFGSHHGRLLALSWCKVSLLVQYEVLWSDLALVSFSHGEQCLGVANL